MPCFHPLQAWRSSGGEIKLGRQPPGRSEWLPFPLPCGGCLGCRQDAAKAWALRCQLELYHPAPGVPPTAVFTTLTYADDQLPPTLDKSHLSGWLKRLRKALPDRIRFFAAGEYGEQTARPHYHAILYGVSEKDRPLIQDTWGKGGARTHRVTARRIAYVAGYCQKKIDWRLEADERMDPDTGELYTWQPPFKLMSRRPGIGATARDKYPASWRSHAVYDGAPLRVPRYLHAGWKSQATDDQLEELTQEKIKHARVRTLEQLAAAEQIAIAKHKLKGSRRSL